MDDPQAAWLPCPYAHAGPHNPQNCIPSPVSTPDTKEAVSAEVIVCAGVIVGVGGESDPCVTQAQADRATRLIVRELNKHGLLRPAVATNEQAVERLNRALELVDEFDGPEAPFEHHHKWVAVRDEITAARAALRAAQSGETR